MKKAHWRLLYRPFEVGLNADTKVEFVDEFEAGLNPHLNLKLLPGLVNSILIMIKYTGLTVEQRIAGNQLG